MDTETVKMERQAKTAVLVVGVRNRAEQGDDHSESFGTQSLIRSLRGTTQRKVQGQSLEPTKKGKTEYLLQKRLKQPFYGYHGFVTGKLRWGELVEEGGKRELLEETGLKGEFKLAGIEHKVDYDQDGKLLEDKFFYIMRVDDPEGELQVDFEGGKNLWISEDEFEKLDKLFQDVLDIVEVVKKPGVQFLETRFTVKDY